VSGVSAWRQAETPPVLPAGDTAILMRLFGAAFRLSCNSLALPEPGSAPPIAKKDRHDIAVKGWLRLL
jgi:hypothetical protein